MKAGGPDSLDIRGGGLFLDMRGVPGSLDMQEMVLGFLDMRRGVLVPKT